MQLTEPHETYGHSFDEHTRLYLLPVRIFPEADGSCPLPLNTVDFPPFQKADQHQAWRINEKQTAWEIVDDYRGAMLWEKSTAMGAPNRLEINEQPSSGVTLLAPLAIEPGEPLTNRWDDELEQWQLVPDYSRVPVWEKATGAVLPMLLPGDPLPFSATDIPPPRDMAGPVRFDDSLGEWVLVPSAPVLPDVPSLRPGANA
jgi:hypothetical protein